MSKLANLLAHAQIAANYDVRNIEIKFNGMKVIEIDGGKEIYKKLVPASLKLDLVEMLWDGEVVYAIQDEQVIVDRLLLFKEQIS
jgi:hypothetical protein